MDKCEGLSWTVDKINLTRYQKSAKHCNPIHINNKYIYIYIYIPYMT